MYSVFTNTIAGPTYWGTVAAARWLGKDAGRFAVERGERERSEGAKRVVVVDADV